MYILILFQIIKWMPPYRDDKALPTPTLTLPNTLFSTIWLFPSFYKKKMLFWRDLKFQKAEKKKFAKRQIRTWVNRVHRSMEHVLPSAPLELMASIRPL